MSKVFLCAFAIGSLTLTPAYAGQKGKPPATPHGNPHMTARTTTTTAAKPHGNPHTATAPTGTSTTTRTHGNPHGATTSATSKSSTTPTTTTISNPIATKIASKPQLASRLERMLPSGMTLARASSGFKNQGQFIAALHVSQNLHIPFADLKKAMTGPNASSLGQSIQKLRPSANSATEATHAETQATADLRVTTTATPTSTTSSSKKKR
jgi:hypothetical protein